MDSPSQMQTMQPDQGRAECIKIVEHFLAMVPFNRQFNSQNSWLDDLIMDENLSVENQLCIIQNTLMSPLCKQYPSSLKYRQLFAKQIIKKCEERGFEVAEELYEIYSSLISENSSTEQLFYKTYILPTSGVVTLQESAQLVSGGTTGLRSWPAALYMVEWAVENRGIFGGKNVLELGCGLGLTGLAVCHMCHPASYVFSDCHAGVLETLQRNILLNRERNNSSTKCCTVPKPSAKSSSGASRGESLVEESREGGKLATPDLDSRLVAGHRPIDIGEWCHRSTRREKGSLVPQSHPHNYEGQREMEGCSGPGACAHCLEGDRLSGQADDPTTDSRTRLSMCCIDWEKVHEDWLSRLNMDVVVAADVIYDTRIIPALVHVLRTLLHCQGNQDGSTARKQPIAILASTIRNEDTYSMFLDSVRTADLEVEHTSHPRNQFLSYDRSCPMQIIQLKARETLSSGET